MIQYLVSILTEGAIFGIMALGLNIIWGWSGDFDLTYYGYVALGAYMTLVLTIGQPTPPAQYILGLQLPYLVALIGAVVSSALMALVVGLIALRHLRGIYFSIVTLGAVYVLYVLAGQYVPLFDGYNGLSGLFNPMGDALGLDFQSYPFFFLGFCILIFVLVLIFMARLSGSRFGLALRSLREDERAAAAFGRDIYRMKLKAYVLGAAFGGLGGGLFAAYLSAFNPSAWSPIEAIILYSAVLVGGKGNIKGVVLGVVIMIVFIQESTRFLPDVPGYPNIIPATREIVIGLVLVLFIRYRPQGLLPERRYIDHSLQAGVDAGGNALVSRRFGAFNRRFRPTRDRRQISAAADSPLSISPEAAVASPLPVLEAAVAPPLPSSEAVAIAPRQQPLNQHQPAEPPTVSAALVVEGLYKHFGGVVAVNNCSFRAAKGQVTGLIGPNGAGKSTAIDLISGFKLADTGTIFFEGTAIQGLPPHRISRRGLIRTFQTPRGWPGLTVLENVLLAQWDPERETIWRSLTGAKQAQHMASQAELMQAREIVTEFGLAKLGNERAGNLSGGQKRLVEFARIRMAAPRLVILDEPMGGVNPVLGERMALAIEGFIAAGTSVIIVEHNLPFIERVAQQVIVMAQGAVIAAGPFESLRSNQSVIDAYLGEVPL
ncbi:MAG TPA: branched-chain amino acid ABC transporter ATP-binding protein/permease [Ktedonobacteraceae bacterium]|nr:branched-chain amino acid ABC transporter ATP-binding protein/permease [Ktedonobacteraceae bacterium]